MGLNRFTKKEHEIIAKLIEKDAEGISNPFKQGLNEFKRPSFSKKDGVTTSVNITKEQKNFLDDNRLMLSSLVRDFLNKLMKGEK